jgi:alpha-galactosidase
MTLSLRAGADARIAVALDGTALGDGVPLLVEVDRRARPLVDPRAAANDALVTVEGRLDGTAVWARWSATRILGDVWEFALALRNDGDAPARVTRMDPLALDLAGGWWRSHWFRSAWGDEFRPEHGTTRHDTILEVRAGRSSHGMIPWLGLERETRDADAGGAALVVAPAWSGNWHIHAMAGGQVTAGISPWQLVVELAPGEAITAPSVVVAAGRDLDGVALALQAAVRDQWLPRTAFTDSVPVEWNHWWPYEDTEVSETVIAANAAAARDLGIQIATVDAGWFGTADATRDWQEQRGDWHLVNTERFPSGLTALGQAIRDAGVLPGFWIEAEAVGSSARLRVERPELLALATDGRRHDPSYRLMTVSLDPDDPTFLGYVCLGSEAGRAHVLDSMDRLIETTGARWIKVDFNIDPDAGCTRTDHGHGAGDGLFRHYLGLYSVLGEVRRRYPDIVLESCSSGGLRIDLGLARHVHAFFLSDPDYTEHHLETVWGASRLLPPLGVLHWSWSQWRGDYPPSRLDWWTLDDDAFDTMLRAAMLHRFGVSLRLTELRPSLRHRLAGHVALYREHVATFVRTGVFLPLTAPPLRGGLGERAPIAQLIAPTGRLAAGDLAAGDRHLLAAFVLPGGARPDAVRPQRLSAGRSYRVTDLGSGTSRVVAAAELADGIALDGPDGVTSWLLVLDPMAG